MAGGESQVKRNRLILAVAALAAAALAVPAGAQMMSAGWKFLEAVRKREGEDVEKSLGATGTATIINTQDYTTGDTALHIVTARRDRDWLNFLLYRGADPNKANNKGERPLGVAVGLDWIDGAQLLIAKGARVDDPGAQGETALIAAVHQRDIEMVRLLLKSGASPTRADNSGRSAADYAALLGSESPIAAEVAAATKTAAARKQKTYGPSF